MIVSMGALLIALLLVPAAPLQREVMTGVVTDPQGSTVPGAIVQLQIAGAVIVETQTGTDGRFTFGIENRDAVQLIVIAAGFTRAFALTAIEPDLERCMTHAGELLETIGTTIAAEILQPDPSQKVPDLDPDLRSETARTAGVTL